jgi:hypothetical protein
MHRSITGNSGGPLILIRVLVVAAAVTGGRVMDYTRLSAAGDGGSYNE